MAQDLSTIFSGTLGATQLESDNEHTLVTTNSNTTHIVKNVTCTAPSTLDLAKGAGTFLELNGHRLADVTTAGLSGELIIPPNSTLKIKNHCFPFSYEYRKTVFLGDSSGRLYVRRSIHDASSGTELSLHSEMKSATTSLGRWNEIIDATSKYTLTNIGGNSDANHIWYTTHDNNSVQTIVSVGIDGENTSSHSQARYENYKAHGFRPDSHITATNQYTIMAVKIDSGYYYVSNLYGGPNQDAASLATWAQQGAFPNRTAAGQIQVSPTSSYPRGMFMIGGNNVPDSANYWMFWIPSSGYSNDIYAFNTSIRQNFRFTMPRGWGGGSGNYNFGVSIDDDNDRLNFWRPANTTSINRHQCTTPWSTITSTTQTTSTNSPIHFNSNSFTDDANLPLNATLNTQGMGSSRLSSRIDGGFAHKGTDGNLHHYDGNGNFLYKDMAFGSDDGDISTANNGAPWFYDAQPAPSFMTSALTPPTFDLTLYGYTIS